MGVAAAERGLDVYAAAGAPGGWLGVAGALSRAPGGRWANAQARDAAVAVTDSYLVLRAMLAQGLGRSALPCILGDADPRLRRLGIAVAPRSVPIWVASHPDLAEVPRIAATRRALIAALGAEAGRLMG